MNVHARCLVWFGLFACIRFGLDLQQTTVSIQSNPIQSRPSHHQKANSSSSSEPPSKSKAGKWILGEEEEDEDEQLLDLDLSGGKGLDSSPKHQQPMQPMTTKTKTKTGATTTTTQTTTTVVNVKVTHIRPRFQNLREWSKDPQNVYIGRAGVVFVPNPDGTKERFPKKSSPFANPFKVKAKAKAKANANAKTNANASIAMPNTKKTLTRAESLALYDKYIREKLSKDAALRNALEALRGKQLGCWCKPEACHGDVLVRLLTANSEK